jgi:hypothetical protein
MARGMTAMWVSTWSIGSSSPSASRRSQHARVMLKYTLLILQEGHEVSDFVRTIEKEWKKLQ